MKKLNTAKSKDSKDPSSGSSPTDVPAASGTAKKPDKVNEQIRKSETVFAAAVDSYPVLVDVDDPQLRDPEVFIVASLVNTQGGFNPDKQVWPLTQFYFVCFCRS